jgi:hypothetical protein
MSVTVSTPRPYEWDLLVVEAKDWLKMPSGLRFWRDRSDEPPGKRTALGVGQRYAAGLRPRAVWVCNHCDFRHTTNVDDNHGTLWTQIHLADQFRPGNVPGAFTESVRAALAPTFGVARDEVPGPAAADPDGPDTAAGRDAAEDRGLVLVLDVTTSMRSKSQATMAAPSRSWSARSDLSRT